MDGWMAENYRLDCDNKCSTVVYTVWKTNTQ